VSEKEAYAKVHGDISGEILALLYKICPQLPSRKRRRELTKQRHCKDLYKVEL
jgi:hypothetical protein